MKTNPWVSILIVALFINTAATAVLSFQYVRSMGALVRLQLQRSRVNQDRAIFQSLVNETVQYSRRNPAVIPVLRQIGVNVSKGVPASTAPNP